MARVVLFHGVDRPLEVAEFPEPRPEGEEIVVRVSCCTLCSSDLHTHTGRRKEATPTVLGHEVVGRIAAFGPRAIRRDFRGADLKVGARVSWTIAASCGNCYYCNLGLGQKCESLFKYGHARVDLARPFTGGLADYLTLVPGSAVFRVPDLVSDPVAAVANCATATVAAMLRSAGEVVPGRSVRNVLVLGAGILGVTACAMARSAGAEVVCVADPNGERLERALRFGATHVSSSKLDELRRLGADATEGRGFDVALELAGVAETVASGLALTRVGGAVILAGTVLPTPSVPLDPEAVVRRMVTIRGVHNYAPSDLATALDFLAGPGQAYPFSELVCRTFRLGCRVGVRLCARPCRKARGGGAVSYLRPEGPEYLPDS